MLQTPRHHALHHTDPKNTFYCPITNMLNPVLERLQFWPRMETAIERVTGIAHRPDTSNRGAGPGPEWLAEYRPQRPAPATATTPKAKVVSKPAACDCSTCTVRATCNPARKAEQELVADRAA